jgi:hypothetical protein
MTANAPVGFFRYIEPGSADLQIESPAPIVAQHCITISDLLSNTNVAITVNPIESPEDAATFRKGFWNPVLDKAEQSEPAAVGFRNFAIVADSCLVLQGEVVQ